MYSDTHVRDSKYEGPQERKMRDKSLIKENFIHKYM